MVAGASLARISSRRSDSKPRANAFRKVCRVQDDLRSGANARPTQELFRWRPGLALCRRSSSRRSHESSDTDCDRYLWKAPSKPERGAVAPGHTVEVRVQGNQSDSEDAIH